MPITDWPLDQRPRERLLARGATALSDAELLALVLRVGVAGKSAVALGEDLLARFGSLRALFAAEAEEVAALPGLGPAKYALLQSVYELARRALAEQLRHGLTLSNAREVRHYLQLQLAHLEYESFNVMFLDLRLRLLGMEEMARGSLMAANVYPREVVKAALARNASAVILAHNHPSGTARASADDRRLTALLKDALALVDVKVVDHFIVAGPEVYSFAEHGEL